jgi:GH43 family beta-xylosidase
MDTRTEHNGSDRLRSSVFSETYHNPVYPYSFPDPFVLKFRGEYFAYCTGFAADGNVFGVLRSRDLVNWTDVGGAMTPLDNGAPFYWAPEVTYWNGKFYLYYSVGNETLMELRVAVADDPTGGFVDSGVVLTREEFAIDAHLFIDEDGQKYLFYATDFLEHTHIGTGTVVDKMVDFFELAGTPRPVTRPRFDWQLYDPNRKEKGGVRWHTVEGSFVLKRKGVYYQMFSGGNWQNISYGVSFATTDDIEQVGEWEQFSDGERVLPILRTVPDLIIGPGHNSVVRGVNNRELYCVYHRWTETGRVLAIDRMDFAGRRLFVAGATCEPQPAPYVPNVIDFFDGESLRHYWQHNGEWEVVNGEVVNKSLGYRNDAAIGKPIEQSELICRELSRTFLCEVTFRALTAKNVKSCFGFCLLRGTEKTFEFLMFPNLLKAITLNFQNGKFKKETFDLPADFDFHAFHLMRIGLDEHVLQVAIDEVVLKFEKMTAQPSNRIALLSENMQAAFSAFAMTKGFEDLFEWETAEAERRGWSRPTTDGEIRLENGHLIFAGPTEKDSWLVKGEAAAEFVFAANYRLVEKYDERAKFGFLVLDPDDRVEVRFSLVSENDRYALKSDRGPNLFPLPTNFDLTDYHQFSFVKSGDKMFFQMEEYVLGEIAVPATELKIGFFGQCATVALEAVRLTIFAP